MHGPHVINERDSDITLARRAGARPLNLQAAETSDHLTGSVSA
jgi:hypothetical protein